MPETELTFQATPERGPVSAILTRPPSSRFLLVLGHGASSNMRHRTVATIAERLADEGIATLRYNFPYSEHRRARDADAVCIATVRSAVHAAHEAAPGLRLLAGGHSFGGRMTTNAAALDPLERVEGLVLFGFPLHLAGSPAIKRAAHLGSVAVPMLFLTGTRDQLAQLDLFRGVLAGLGPSATLHLVETADHSFVTLKRARASKEDAFAEIARVVREWCELLPARG